MNELKGVIRSFHDELQLLIGDVRVIFATKKRSSIGNSVVRNKQLSLTKSDATNQRCNAGGCRQCPAVIDSQKVSTRNHLQSLDRWIVNRKTLCISGYVNYAQKLRPTSTAPHRSAAIGPVAIAVASTMNQKLKNPHYQCMPGINTLASSVAIWPLAFVFLRTDGANG